MESNIKRYRRSPFKALKISHAMESIIESVRVNMTKTVSAPFARCGMVLAKSIKAKVDIPNVLTSMKDGYAVISSDGTRDRAVIGVSTAGNPINKIVIPGTCVRISTGAVVPKGADAVVVLENTSLISHDGKEEKSISVQVTPCSFQNIRAVGTDMRKDEIVLEKNCILNSAEIGILAASGNKYIEIYRRPKVCVISTGNELVDWSISTVPANHVRDTNRPQLLALLESNGFKAIDGGIVGDTEEQLTEAIDVAFKYCNAIVMTGGVSMGEYDLVKSVLEKKFHFNIHFGRVYMKPGLPTTYATGKYLTDDKRYIFALPGNPVSSWVSCHLFAIPALRKMAGHNHPLPTTIEVKLVSPVDLDNRPEMRRAWLASTDMVDSDEVGPWAVWTADNQTSSCLLNTKGANLLVQLPSKTEVINGRLECGAKVNAFVIGPI